VSMSMMVHNQMACISLMIHKICYEFVYLKNIHYRKSAQLWRKNAESLTEIHALRRKLWRKTVRQNPIGHNFYCDGSVTIVTEKLWWKYTRHNKLWRTIATDFFRQKNIMTENYDGKTWIVIEIVTDLVTEKFVTIWKKSSQEWGLLGLWPVLWWSPSQIVTDSVTIARHYQDLWRKSVKN